jgi:hypothetical protein
MDLLIEGEFKKYGEDVIRLNEMEKEDREEKMRSVFKKVKK